MPTWHRRSHASGWGGVAATEICGRTKGRLDGKRTLIPGRHRDVRFAPTMVMHWAGGRCIAAALGREIRRVATALFSVTPRV